MKTPVVSVIMPTYNRRKLLERAVDSVLSQTLTDFEFIIVNDASTDDTKVFLDGLAKKDARVRPIHHEKNYYPDISRTLNEAMKIAQGTYIARLDDDDYWCDAEKLSKQVAFFDSHPDFVLTGRGTIVIDENDKERFRYLKPEDDATIRNKALFANPFTHSTVMFRREVALAAGGYGDFKNAEDWDLWLRMGQRGRLYNFQEYFVRYLLTDKSKTVLFKRSQADEILHIVASHRKEYPNFLPAYILNVTQYCYSQLPAGIRRILYNSLSRAKRSLFANQGRRC